MMQAGRSVFLSRRVLAALAIFPAVIWFAYCVTAKKPQPPSSIPYTLLEDNLGIQVLIGVDACATDEELRNALTTAADNLQNDPARDYMLSHHLTVKAFLLFEPSPEETYFAGSIRRYVPVPEEKKDNATSLKWIDWFVAVVSGNDSFNIGTEEARKRIRQSGYQLLCSQ